MKRFLAALGIIVLVAIAAVAQDDGTPSDNGFLINMLQSRLSAPGRQIALTGVSGALSSTATIQKITISDAKGPWLEIDNVELDWNRLALLRGRVSVNLLHAERIAWLRKAETPPQPRALPQAEATPFSLPELPVAINLAKLQLDHVTFAEPVFGQAADLSATGALSLAGGALDTTLDVKRLDAPGGELTAKASFSNATRELGIDVALQEPQGGVVATLLKIEGKPAIDLRVNGSGPLDQVDVNFSLDAGSDRIAEGVVALRARDDGLGFDVNFNGGLSPLIPPQFRDFFAGQSTVKVVGVKKSAGGLRIDDLKIAGAALNLQGGVETGPDNFLRNLTLTGSLGDPTGPAITLPVPGGRTSLRSAELHLDFGSGSRWDGLVVLDRLKSADIEIEDVTLRLGGLAQHLDDPATRNVTVNVEGLATGVWAADPEVARALGTRIDLFADAALPPGGTVTVNQLQLSGNGLSIFSAGQFKDMVYTGRNAVRIADLAIFAGIADRPLGGAIDLRANGSVTPLAGGFDLTFDGGTTDLAIGNERLDPLLAGATQVSGRAVRDEAGIRTEDLRITNPQLSFASDGLISSKKTDIGFQASLADLHLVDPRLQGALTANGRASGEGRPITVSVAAAVPEGELMGRRLTDARVGFDGQVDGSNVTGTLSGGGGLDGLVLSLGGDIASVGDKRSISGLELRVGPNRLSGDLTKDGAAPIDGRLTLHAPEIAPLASLALVEATGAIDADIQLAPAEVGQGISLVIGAMNLEMGANRIGQLDARAEVKDAFALPMVDGQLSASDLALAGIEVSTLNAKASPIDPRRMSFSADARLAVGTLADLSGELDRLDDGFAVTLDTLRLRQQGVTAALTAPSTVTMRGSAIEVTPLVLDFGSGGKLTAQGRMDENFDVDLAISNLPLALANAIRPDLGLAGSINGTGRVTGPRTSPDVRFDVKGTGLASSMTRNAGLPPVEVDASGQTANSRLNLIASVASGAGLAAKVQGSVPLGAGNLDVAIDLQAFPLALVDRIAGNRGLRGTVTGTGHATGPLADPTVSFDVRGEGIAATLLTQNGLPPLGATAAGSYRAGALDLGSARVTGAGGLDIQGSGRIPFAGSGLDANVTGTVPLAIADSVLAARSVQATGTLRVTATARGSLAAPQLGGTVSLDGGTLFDPQTNVRLQDITLDASLEGNAAVLRSFRAGVVTGGNITAEGRVALTPGYPADLAVRLNNVRYTDGVFVSTRLDGDLALNGPIVGGGGMLRGQITLGRTEISIAEGLGPNVAQALNQVDHVDASAGVRETLARARVDESSTGTTTPTSSRAGIGLDVRISAPNQIFVRGRGLDVELGGELRVQGTTTDIQPVGQFDLRRGRLVVLGQRIEFDEGSLQLVGNLDPQIHFVARTTSGDVTAIVTVDGRVSAPKISFSSEPELPQDEVLARVLFNSTTQNLSAFQLAQLAGAAAELAGGGGGPGILSQIRGATGLDDLDVVTQEDGSTAVRAGKYLTNNVYVDVQSDTQGVSRAEINLDVTDNLTARASVASDGNSTIGLFFERDY